MSSRALPQRKHEDHENAARKKVPVKPCTGRSVLGEVGNKLRLGRIPTQALKKPVTAESEVKESGLKSVQCSTNNLKEASRKITKTSSIETEVERLEQAFSMHLIAEVENIDRNDENNPQLVVQYVNDIYAYMRKLESEMPIRHNFLEGQEITGNMRGVLVAWMVEVHCEFHLLQETLFLAVALLDRYMQVNTSTTKSNFQLLGVTSLMIASKYEEVYPPVVGDFVFITESTCSKSEILAMERKILQNVDFQLGRPIPLHFLRRFSKAGSVTPIQHTLAKYLLELSLLVYNFCHFKPSHLAAAALFMALNIMKGSQETPYSEHLWTPTLIFYSHFIPAKLKPVSKRMAKFLFMDLETIQTVKQKYMSRKLLKVADLPELKSSWVKSWACED